MRVVEKEYMESFGKAVRSFLCAGRVLQVHGLNAWGWWSPSDRYDGAIAGLRHGTRPLMKTPT
jgi:hypothetical protein